MLKKWQDKALHFSNIADSYAQKCANEIQKFCEFEIKFCQNDPGDGLVLCYDKEDYKNCHLTMDKAVKLYQLKKRKLTLDDVKCEY